MIKWIEILSTDVAKLTETAKALNVNPLALEDCLHRDQRAKLDNYDDHQLLVWFLMTKGKIYEIQFLVFADQLIVVPHAPPPEGENWREYLHISRNHSDVWLMLYHALDKAKDLTWLEVRSLVTKIDEFEDEMFKKEIDPQKLIHLKKKLNKIENAISLLPSVALQMQNLCSPTGELKWKLRDLHDNYERMFKNLAMYRSQISSTIDLYWGLQANRTNRQIKKITVLASIAVPITIWSSIWGMNFETIPFSSARLFYTAIGLMALTVITTLWLIVRKGYWND
jgi:magnesium transporter